MGAQRPLCINYICLLDRLPVGLADRMPVGLGGYWRTVPYRAYNRTCGQVACWSGRIRIRLYACSYPCPHRREISTTKVVCFVRIITIIFMNRSMHPSSSLLKSTGIQHALNIAKYCLFLGCSMVFEFTMKPARIQH